jgi:DNA repair photolyase
MLRESKGNMYEFITATWNAIKGKCPHDCSYCYMKRYPQKEMRLDEAEFKTDLGSGNFIFVGSSIDMFANEIPELWIIKTLNHCRKFNNEYFLQTKNPKRIWDFLIHDMPDNFSICTTLESNRDYPKIRNNAPDILKRVYGMQLFKHTKKYITIEPIMDFDLNMFINKIYDCEPIQVNIGSDSGNNKLPEPNPEKVKTLVNELQKFTKVHLKKNLQRLMI